MVLSLSFGIYNFSDLNAQTALDATAKFSRPFSNHAVLQQKKPVPVWGTGIPGATVQVSFAGQKKTGRIDANGKWKVVLDPMQASKIGRELHLQVLGSPKITKIKDVLVGEVWLCSGQSNMAWTICAILTGNDAKLKKVINGATNPAIRQLRPNGIFENITQDDIAFENGKPNCWTIAKGAGVIDFTAAGYYFARKLAAELDVPVGLINGSVGGSRIEPWIPAASLKRNPELISTAAKIPSPAEKITFDTPTSLYNGMIHPLKSFAIRGVIWYQGESNAGEGKTYLAKMQALINGWRKEFGQGNFPFYFVQLASYGKSDYRNAAGDDPGGWVPTREAQLHSLALPNTGMVVTIDIGESKNIHPVNKEDVGTRLALWPLAKVYGKTKLIYSGPLYRSHTIEGSKICLSFDHAESGLMVGKKIGTKPTSEFAGGKLKWFSIAGKDGVWHRADAKIEGKNVVVSSPHVLQPVAVSYAYAMFPIDANLYNKAGLPASPFRIDLKKKK